MDEMIHIEIVKGPAKGRVFTVKGAGFSIGRSTEPDEIDCALMEDHAVSRRHARGRLEHGRVVLEDWPGFPSKAGLVAGGQRREKVVLGEGEPVTVGRSTLVFRLSHVRSRSPFKMSPAWRRWIGLGVLLAMTSLGAAAWSGRPDAAGTRAEDRLERAWGARCRGDLEDALRVLREAPAEPDEAGAASLERECRRYARLFEGPRRLEESLRLDEARDAWTRVAQDLHPHDPLRAWVETGCVARLDRQLRDLRR